MKDNNVDDYDAVVIIIIFIVIITIVIVIININSNNNNNRKIAEQLTGKSHRQTHRHRHLVANSIPNPTLIPNPYPTPIRNSASNPILPLILTLTLPHDPGNLCRTGKNLCLWHAIFEGPKPWFVEATLYWENGRVWFQINKYHCIGM